MCIRNFTDSRGWAAIPPAAMVNIDHRHWSMTWIADWSVLRLLRCVRSPIVWSMNEERARAGRGSPRHYPARERCHAGQHEEQDAMLNTELDAAIMLRELERERRRYQAEARAMQALDERRGSSDGKPPAKPTAAMPLFMRLARGWQRFRGAPEACRAEAPA
jgi:hypothetical protein